MLIDLTLKVTEQMRQDAKGRDLSLNGHSLGSSAGGGAIIIS